MDSRIRILLIDDEQPARYAMAKALQSANYEIHQAEDGRAGVDAIRTGAYDLVFLDLTMPIMDGQSLLREISNERLESTVEIIVVTADDNVPTAVECIRLGASDFISKPYEIEQIRAIARRVADRVALQERVQHLQNELENRQAFGAIVGISRPMRDLFSQIERVAKAPLDVLIQGETGTGKELIAREIHELSPRAEGPFIAINTAAMTESLVESELFGHTKGAFTGADSDRKGCFELANGGTLFLDEIGDMPLAAQSKMLRALQQRTVQPVGSSQTMKVDVRVISATHQDLETSVADNHFRQDLYFRIKGVALRVPPLRERREDILVLAHHFLNLFNDRTSSSLEFNQSALDAMLTHAWPGNVRELEHSVLAAATMCEATKVSPTDLQLTRSDVIHDDSELGKYLDYPLTEAKSRLVEDYERMAITKALDASQGNVSAAARQLGIHRQSLQQKMTALGIRRS